MNIKNIMTNAFGRSLYFARKYSPEILLGTGVVGVVVSTVLACKATLKINEIEKANQEVLLKIVEAKNTYEETVYSEEDYDHDLVIARVQGVMRYIKLYAPSVGLGLVSIGLILTAHGVLSKRNAAIMAAYKILDSAYNNYRRRVIEDIGENADRYFRFGIPQEKVTEKVTDADGKETEVEKIVTPVSEQIKQMVEQSGYARFFDESSVQWRKTHDYNLFFLKAQQNYANDLLRARGHVFLNEVYDMLGLPRSKAGAVVGWVGGHGDDYIDFHIFDPINEGSRDFVNGYKHAILLDFNIDGIIYDII